jgi:hypothetical protein
MSSTRLALWAIRKVLRDGLTSEHANEKVGREKRSGVKRAFKDM